MNPAVITPLVTPRTTDETGDRRLYGFVDVVVAVVVVASVFVVVVVMGMHYKKGVLVFQPNIIQYTSTRYRFNVFYRVSSCRLLSFQHTVPRKIERINYGVCCTIILVLPGSYGICGM
jgi:hypothetical protein